VRYVPPARPARARAAPPIAITSKQTAALRLLDIPTPCTLQSCTYNDTFSGIINADVIGTFAKRTPPVIANFGADMLVSAGDGNALPSPAPTRARSNPVHANGALSGVTNADILDMFRKAHLHELPTSASPAGVLQVHQCPRLPPRV